MHQKWLIYGADSKTLTMCTKMELPTQSQEKNLYSNIEI